MDPVAAMREHIAYLQSELAWTVKELAALRASVEVASRRAWVSVEAGNHATARRAILALGKLEEDAELLNADIRVLRALLEECYECLEHPA